MQDRLILRDARGDELARVSALLQSAYAEHRAHFPGTVWQAYRAELAAVADQSGAGDLIVALHGDAIVGTITFFPEASRDGHNWPPGIASIRLLAVDSGARRSGVGRALVTACVERAARVGASHVGLHTAAFMQAANRLYADLGFVRARQFDFDAEEHYGGVAGALKTGQLAGEAFLLPVTGSKAAE